MPAVRLVSATPARRACRMCLQRDACTPRTSGAAFSCRPTSVAALYQGAGVPGGCQARRALRLAPLHVPSARAHLLGVDVTRAGQLSPSGRAVWPSAASRRAQRAVVTCSQQVSRAGEGTRPSAVEGQLSRGAVGRRMPGVGRRRWVTRASSRLAGGECRTCWPCVHRPRHPWAERVECPSTPGKRLVCRCCFSSAPWIPRARRTGSGARVPAVVALW